MTWDDAAARWIVRTDTGRTLAATYVVTAVGCLSAANVPSVPGLEDFGGDWFHTGRWPHEGVDFAGRRVAQIGTGSTGIQAVPVIAETGGHYGVAPEAIARASLTALPIHAMSPLIAAIYLVCGLLKVDVGAAQRFSLKWAVLSCLVMLGAALASGAVPFRVG